MKKWSRPVTFVQEFEANEYVAACGTQYGNYLFECDAPGGRLYYYKTDWWGNKSAQYLGNYTPCSKKHEASRENEFPDGFVDYNRNGREDDGEAVIVWIERGPFGSYDGHATTNLDRDSWEVTKS